MSSGAFCSNFGPEADSGRLACADVEPNFRFGPHVSEHPNEWASQEEHRTGGQLRRSILARGLDARARKVCVLLQRWPPEVTTKQVRRS